MRFTVKCHIYVVWFLNHILMKFNFSEDQKWDLMLNVIYFACIFLRLMGGLVKVEWQRWWGHLVQIFGQQLSKMIVNYGTARENCSENSNLHGLGESASRRTSKWRTVKKITSQNLCPELIRFHALIKTARSAVLKNRAERSFEFVVGICVSARGKLVYKSK